MKLHFKEHNSVDYNNYSFPYCVYCIKEEGDKYSDIYSQGFLPYTNNLDIEDEIYYLAKSIRVDLADKIWNSKQKNVFNKFAKIYDENHIKIELKNKAEYIYDENFDNWCLKNAKNNFLNRERLKYIQSRLYLKNIMTISYKGELLAHLYVVRQESNFLHVWFNFYDLKKDMNDFGKWIILQAIQWTKDNNYKYFYIGTCYSRSAFYKLTLSPKVQYFDGMGWNNDISNLKKRLLSERELKKG